MTCIDEGEYPLVGIITSFRYGWDTDEQATIARVDYALCNGFNVGGSLTMSAVSDLFAAYKCDIGSLVGKPVFMECRNGFTTFLRPWIAI